MRSLSCAELRIRTPSRRKRRNAGAGTRISRPSGVRSGWPHWSPSGRLSPKLVMRWYRARQAARFDKSFATLRGNCQGKTVAFVKSMQLRNEKFSATGYS